MRQRIQRQAETFAYRLAAELPPQIPAAPPPADERESRQFWGPTRDMVKQLGAQPRSARGLPPVKLKGGGTTDIYLNPKTILSTNGNMKLASQAMLEHAKVHGIDYNAVGGPTMGGDVLSHGMVAHSDNPDLAWFSVRDKPKTDHGLGNMIEGAELGPQHRVILTDDVADSGKSLEEAYHHIINTGAQVSAVMPMVERGDRTAARFAALGVPYHPLMNYNDLGIGTLSQPQKTGCQWP